MPTPWTRVPHTAPPLDALQLRLLPLVDAFMWLMLSRPGGLSLRTAWVTSATIWLCLGVAVILFPLSAVLLASGISGARLLLLVGGLVAIALAVGTGAIALYGTRQRFLHNAVGPRDRIQ